MRLITLNGVKLLVYRNGMILRYSKTGNRTLRLGWQQANYDIGLDGYKRIPLKMHRYRWHRVIASAFLGLDITNPTQIIDHIDRNKLNNNLNNLRIVSFQENAFNKEAKGYSWNKKAQKYKGHIKINNQPIHLGMFDTEEEARQAYLDAKAKYHIISDTLN